MVTLNLIKSMTRQQFKDKLGYTKSVILLNSPFIGTLLFSVPIIETKDGYIGAYLDGKKIKIHESITDSLDRKGFAAMITKLLFHMIFFHVKRIKESEDKGKFAYAANQATNSVIDTELGCDLSDYISLKDEIFEYKHDFKCKSADEIYNELEGNYSEGQSEFVLFLLNSNDMDKEELDEFKNDLMKSYNLNKNFGDIPASIQQVIDLLKETKVDWKRVLKQNIQKQFIDYTYNEPDRRFLRSKIVLPTITGEKFKILVGVDLSGSIDKTQSDAFLTDIYNLLKVFTGIEIILMTFDTQAYNVKTIKSRKELLNYEMLGGGGTDCYEVLKYANENKNKIDYTVIFTDGYLEFHEEFKKTKNLYWLLYNSDVKPTYGKYFKYQLNK